MLEFSLLITDNLLVMKTSLYLRKFLSLAQPVIVGLIFFPVVVLFWQCGWNLGLIILDLINGIQSIPELEELKKSTIAERSNQQSNLSKSHKKLFKKFTDNFSKKSKKFKGSSRRPLIMENQQNNYSYQSLIICYLIIQIILLVLYLKQDLIYIYLKKQKSILKFFLLKSHVFLLATIYIIQWEILWIMWDQYTYFQWYFELFLSFTFILILIILMGHLSDLICVPFVISYDSIDYCVKFDCPFQTFEVSLDW